jgi:hypothetical protein
MGLLLSVLAGLLALAAIIGPAIFKRIRPPQQPSTPRRGISDDVDAENPPMPCDAAQDVQIDNKSREAQDLDAQNGDLQKILQRISRPAA